MTCVCQHACIFVLPRVTTTRHSIWGSPYPLSTGSDHAPPLPSHNRVDSGTPDGLTQAEITALNDVIRAAPSKWKLQHRTPHAASRGRNSDDAPTLGVKGVATLVQCVCGGAHAASTSRMRAVRSTFCPKSSNTPSSIAPAACGWAAAQARGAPPHPRAWSRGRLVVGAWAGWGRGCKPLA